MKKILISIITAASMLIGASAAYADTASTVQISNGDKLITYRYTAGSKSETIKNISELFTTLSDITAETRETEQELKLTGASTDGSAVDMVLIMTDGTDKPESKEKSVIGIYDIEVTDADGSIISKINAGTDDIEIDNTGKYIKNISLGRLNEASEIEEKTYKLKISVAEDISESDIELANNNTKWFIKGISDKKDAVTPEPTATPEASAEPEQEIMGTKYVGKDKDIMPGKYILTGNGSVKVYDSKGEIKEDVVLTDGKSESAEGAVASYVLNLADGDKVEIYDHISLKPYNKTAAATAAPRGTAAPATAKSNKTNPKTADTAPIAAVAVTAAAALGVFAYLEYSKRKKIK